MELTVLDEINRLPFDERVQLLHRIRTDLLAEALPPSREPSEFEATSAAQSKLFMIDLIPVIHRLFWRVPVNHSIDVLDVGPQSLSGTKLLADLHTSAGFNNLKMNVEAIDIVDTWERYRQITAPDVPLRRGDIFETAPKPWDLVICSHTIEHVVEPRRFIDRLRSLSCGYVVVAAPFMEEPLTTTGHINTIEKRFLRMAGAVDINVYTNYMWGKDREVFVAVFEGRAIRETAG